MDVDETPVTRGSPDGNAVNDAGTTKDPDLTVLEEEEEKENEFVMERSGSLNPVDEETDTLPTDVLMEESEPISQEPVDVVTGTNAGTENIAAIVGKPELLIIETVDDHVKTEGEVHEHVDQGITTLNAEAQNTNYSNKWLIDTQIGAANVSGTIEEQAAFMKELEIFHIERALDFKPTKFYGEPLNCLKLWRSVIMLGGYDHVTTNKYWRQIGESFRPPKTCTTISWTFRNFYEKALLEYERHEIQAGLQLPVNSMPTQTIADKDAGQAVGSHKARRDSSSRAVKGQRSGEDVSLTLKRDKNPKSIGSGEHKNPTNHGRTGKDGHPEADKRMVTTVIDVGPPADWVKVSVQENKDCFEIYALVPGLLREEVRVQSDPAGRLVITGQPEQPENPWGITPFKKVVNLPVRIDPRQTSAVVSLHGRLYVRVPFEQGSLTN